MTGVASRLDRTHLRRHAEHSSYELLRPGFTRLTLSYLLSEEELQHTITALRSVTPSLSVRWGS